VDLVSTLLFLYIGEGGSRSCSHVRTRPHTWGDQKLLPKEATWGYGLVGCRHWNWGDCSSCSCTKYQNNTLLTRCETTVQSDQFPAVGYVEWHLACKECILGATVSWKNTTRSPRIVPLHSKDYTHLEKEPLWSLFGSQWPLKGNMQVQPRWLREASVSIEEWNSVDKIYWWGDCWFKDNQGI